MSTILIYGLNSPLLITEGYGVYATTSASGIKLKIFDDACVSLYDTPVVKLFDFSLELFDGDR